MAHAIADWRLTLDGEDISSRFRPRLSSLILTDKREAEADELQIVLTDEDGRLALPRTGAILVLALGWKIPPPGLQAGLVEKGSFKVDKVGWSGAPDQVFFSAKSCDFTGDLRVRRSQSWHATTLGAVLGEIAARQGLALAIDPGLAGRAVPLVEQSRESDAALFARLGREHDAVATIKAGRLIFSPKGKSATAAGGVALPRFELTRRQGDQARYERAERDTYSGVEAAWHDRDGAAQRKVTAGAAGNAKRLRRTYASESSARRAAEAEWAKAQREGATFNYTTAWGRPDLCAEQRGTLRGFKTEIDAGEWLINMATHTLGDAGLGTVLALETAP